MNGGEMLNDVVAGQFFNGYFSLEDRKNLNFTNKKP